MASHKRKGVPSGSSISKWFWKSFAALLREKKAQGNTPSRRPSLLEPEGQQIHPFRPSTYEGNTEPDVFRCGCLGLLAGKSCAQRKIAARPVNAPSALSHGGASAELGFQIARALPHHNAHRSTNRPSTFRAVWLALV